MRRPLFLSALGLVVVSSAFVLVQVAGNRAGEPDAEVHLDGRELSPSLLDVNDESLTTVRLRWVNPTMQDVLSQKPVEWLDRAKLQDLGFDLSVSPASPDAQMFYYASQSRQVFVALEFDGPSREKWLATHRAQLESLGASQIDDQIASERKDGSRLVAIDVSRDLESLRRKYPNRQQIVILRGLVRITVDVAQAVQPAHLRGYIPSLLNESLYVPSEFRPMLGGSFVATLAVGKRYEPWIVDLKKQ